MFHPTSCLRFAETRYDICFWRQSQVVARVLEGRSVVRTWNSGLIRKCLGKSAIFQARSSYGWNNVRRWKSIGIFDPMDIMEAFLSFPFLSMFLCYPSSCTNPAIPWSRLWPWRASAQKGECFYSGQLIWTPHRIKPFFSFPHSLLT